MSQVRSRAKSALKDGMAQLSQADVGSALQIFFNLQTLPEASIQFILASILLIRTPITLESTKHPCRCNLCTCVVWSLQFVPVQFVLAIQPDKLMSWLLVQAVKELVEGYVAKMDKLISNALDARRLTSAGAAAGGFLGAREGGHGLGPGNVGSTAKLAELLWQNLTEASHQHAIMAAKTTPSSYVHTTGAPCRAELLS